MKQGKRKNRKNSCFTEIRNRDKNSSIRWMDLTRVNYKFQGARYRSGSRNRIIPLVRDKLYAKPELKYRRYEFQTGQQIPPSPAALSTRNNPTIWSVTGWRGRGRAAIFNPAIEHRGWMKIIKSCARILARARSVPFPPPRRLSTGRDRNFSTVLPTGFDIFGTRAASSSASGSTSKYNRANICPRREATASKTIGGSIVISASSRYTASAPSPPPHPVICQHPVSGSKGLIFDYYRPSVCPAEQAGLLLRGACLAMDPSSTLWKLLLAWIKSI